MAWKRKTGVDTTTSLPTGLASWRKISSYIKQLIKASHFEYHESEAFEVIDVLLNNPTQRGAVIGTFINNPTQEILGGVVLPLMPHITNIPLIGEHVVVTEYNGQHFYTSIINRKGSVNENAIPGASGIYTKDQKYGDTFERTDIKHVEINEGEIVYEGRFGNSIKFGCDPQSKDSKTTSSSLAPNIRIRAGQSTDYKGLTAVATEDINKDKSSIYLSTGEKGDNSIIIKGGKFADKNVSGNSIVMNSDKLFFNSRDGDVHLRASKDVIFESSKGSIVLNAKSGQTIKMGDPKAPMLPTINGQKLLEFQTSIMGVLAGIQAIFVSVGSGLLPKVATDAKKLMDDISIVEEAVTDQTFLNKQVLTADPNFKLPEMPKIPKPPVPKIAKLKLDQSIKIPKKPSITDLTDKI